MDKLALTFLSQQWNRLRNTMDKLALTLLSQQWNRLWNTMDKLALTLLSHQWNRLQNIEALIFRDHGIADGIAEKPI